MLHVITTASIGGAERHLLELMKLLPKDRFEITLAFFKEEAHEARSLVPDFRATGIRVVDLRMKSGLDPRPLWRLLRLVVRFRPDIVHTHLYRADIAGTTIARLLRVPVVVASVHNLDLETNYQRIKPMVLSAYRRASGVIAISHAVRRQLIESYGLQESQVRTIHYGLDTNDWPAPDRSQNQDAVLGTVGRLAYQKGYDVLLSALSKVSVALPSIHLRIIGHDDEGLRRKLEDQAKDLNVVRHVAFEGFSDSIRRELLDMDVFVLASRWEGFGLVLLEAMAAGLPVVATKVGPIPEICLEDVTALLVPPNDAEALADALQRLAVDTELRTRLGAAGRQRFLESFSSSVTAKKTISVYEELLSDT